MISETSTTFHLQVVNSGPCNLVEERIYIIYTYLFRFPHSLVLSLIWVGLALYCYELIGD